MESARGTKKMDCTSCTGMGEAGSILQTLASAPSTMTFDLGLSADSYSIFLLALSPNWVSTIGPGEGGNR